jgi:hypothetical protein
MPVEEQANRNLCFTGDGYQRYAKPKMSASSLPHECVTIEINHLQDRKCILIPVREFQAIGSGTLSRLAAYQRLSTSQSPEQVAIEFGLLCEQTSCVLVAVRDIKAEGLPALRTIRHTRPAGEAGFGSFAIEQPALYSISPQYFCSELDCGEAPSCIPKEPLSPVFNIVDTVDSDVNEGLVAIDDWLVILNEAAASNSLQLSFACLKNLGIDFKAILMINTDFYPETSEHRLVFEILQIFLDVTNAGRAGRALRHWLQQQGVTDDISPDIADDIRRVLTHYLSVS